MTVLKGGREKPTAVTLKEDVIDGIGGFYGYETHVLSVPATTGDHNFDYSWDIPIAIFGGDFTVPAACIGDVMRVEFAPDTVIGALAVDCLSNRHGDYGNRYGTRERCPGLLYKAIRWC